MSEALESLNLGNFIRASQYYAIIKADADIYSETTTILGKFFHFHNAFFVKRDINGKLLPFSAFLEEDHDLSDIESFVSDVFETGFLRIEEVQKGTLKTFVFLPVSSFNKVDSVLVSIYEGTEQLPKEGLDILLAVSTICGSMLEKQETRHRFDRLAYQSRTILESAGEGIFGLSTDGAYTFVNPAAAEMLGYTIDELLNEGSHEKCHHCKPDGTPCLDTDCPIYRSIKDKKIYSGDDEFFIRKDGSFFPVEYISTPIVEEGEAKGAVVVFKDISERKKSQEILLEKQEKIKKLLDKERHLKKLLQTIAHVNELLITSDSVEMLIKKSCETLAQYGTYRLAMITLFDSKESYAYVGAHHQARIEPIPAEIRENIENNTTLLSKLEKHSFYESTDLTFFKYPGFQEIAHDLSIRRYSVVPLRQDVHSPCFGILILFSTRQKRSKYADQERKMIVELAGDIGFAIHAYRQKGELIELNRLLEEKVVQEVERRRKQEQFFVQQSKLAAMGEMIGAIAHQWRQPITAISMAVSNVRLALELGDEITEEQLRHMTGVISELTQYLSQTIDDFRNFFKTDKTPEIFDCKAAIEETIHIVAAQLKHNFIDLEVACESCNKSADTSFQTLGLPSEFKQVILNLISNAKDAIMSHTEGTDTGESGGTIKIVLAQQNKEISISVIDNGGGIDEAIIDRVFEPYYTTKEQGKGTGIGLYMSKMIIEEHMNGVLQVINTDGGACFTIKLARVEEKKDSVKNFL